MFIYFYNNKKENISLKNDYLISEKIKKNILKNIKNLYGNYEYILASHISKKEKEKNIYIVLIKNNNIKNNELYDIWYYNFLKNNLYYGIYNMTFKEALSKFNTLIK